MNTKWMLNDRLGAMVGDITEQKVDVIVNAANSSLLGGGGVDGVINRKGGPEILKACKKIRKERFPKGLPTGQAVITPGGKLPCSHVIHTVGPVWHGGKSGEPDELASAYTESLKLAKEVKAETVVFPAISTGVYAYPKDQAGKIAFRMIGDFLADNEYPQKVILIFFAERDAKVFLEACGL